MSWAVNRVPRSYFISLPCVIPLFFFLFFAGHGVAESAQNFYRNNVLHFYRSFCSNDSVLWQPSGVAVHQRERKCVK